MVIFHSYVSSPEGNGIEHGHLIWFHWVFIVVSPFKKMMKFWNHDLAIELKVANPVVIENNWLMSTIVHPLFINLWVILTTLHIKSGGTRKQYLPHQKLCILLVHLFLHPMVLSSKNIWGYDSLWSSSALLSTLFIHVWVPKNPLNHSHCHCSYSWLVVLTILKNMKVSWDYYSQYMENVPNHQPSLYHSS